MFPINLKKASYFCVFFGDSVLIYALLDCCEKYLIIFSSSEFGILAEVWKQNIGDQFQIEPSTQGIQNVHLKCGSNSMFVKLETDADFTGVMYTKGNDQLYLIDKLR